jgi:hypothetical protein
MRILRGNQPAEPKYDPPRRYQPKEPFCDMRASHWVEIILTLALFGVGISQLLVYSRQAELMATQAQIADDSNALQRAIQRASIKS